MALRCPKRPPRRLQTPPRHPKRQSRGLQDPPRSIFPFSMDPLNHSPASKNHSPDKENHSPELISPPRPPRCDKYCRQTKKNRKKITTGAPIMTPVASRTPKMPPRRLQDGPRRLQDAPRRSQDAAQTPQNAPKRPPRRLIENP